MSSTGSDHPTPDTAMLDSAMASGTDAGEPGGHLGPGDLDPDEARLLAALARDARGVPEESPDELTAEVRAAEDDAPLPAQGGTQDDGLTPRFTAPPATD